MCDLIPFDANGSGWEVWALELHGALSSRATSPMLTAPPIAICVLVVLFDLGQVVSGHPLLAELSYWILTFAVAVSTLVVTGLLVSLTSGPVGLPERRAAGIVTGALTGASVALAMVWWLRTDGSSAVAGGQLVVELFALGLALAGVWTGRVLAGPPVREVAPVSGLPFFT
jgi:uncharacterized membrane protein